MLPILILPTPRRAPIDFAEARRVDELDAKRGPVRFDRNGRLVRDLEERRRRWRRRCGVAKEIVISPTVPPANLVRVPVPAGIDRCEALVTQLLCRQLQNLPRRTRENLRPLLELTYPATIPARRTSPEAMAWMLSLATWRGASTLGQLRLSPLCIQTLTWKWWISVPEALRNGPADRLLDSLSVRVASLYRFWASIARRMEIYEFFFLDPRLISIQFEPKPKRKRRNLPTIDRIASLRDRENNELDEAEELETEPTPVD